VSPSVHRWLDEPKNVAPFCLVGLEVKKDGTSNEGIADSGENGGEGGIKGEASGSLEKATEKKR